MKITVNELLDALQAAAAPVEVDGAFTVSELAGASHWNQRTLREHILILKRAGMVEVVKVTREGLDGRAAVVPAYRFVKKHKKAA